MKRADTLRYEFVQSIPDRLDDATLYVSMDYATAAHKCCCGCGKEVVTPLSPTDWKVTFDGVSVSLHPSIGNWSFACRSHYWIDRNAVRWAGQWSDEEIAAGRAHDQRSKAAYYSTKSARTADKGQKEKTPQQHGLWSWLARWWKS